MKIVMNAVLSYEQPRGVGRYLNALIPALARIDRDNQYYIYYGAWMKDYSFLKVQQENFHFLPLEIRNRQLSRNMYLALILPLKCKKLNPDLYMLIDTQATLLKPCRMVSVIHDLAEFEVPEKYSKKQALLRRMIVRIQVLLSNRIITVSEYSKADLQRRLKIPADRIRCVYNGLNREQFGRVTDQLAETDNSFLFVSEQERAKAPCVLADAFSLLPEDLKLRFHLVYVGREGNDSEELNSRIIDYGLEQSTVFKGYVDDSELNQLYARAYAFVFPSLFEGFGLPVLEAMSKGTPVLCSNRASIPEVGGDAVLTFDPEHPEELTGLMRRLAEDSELRRRMICKGLERAKSFTTERMAEETLLVLRTACKNEFR